jgi:hypothetical protein
VADTPTADGDGLWLLLLNETVFFGFGGLIASTLETRSPSLSLEQLLLLLLLLLGNSLHNKKTATITNMIIIK